jgi:hypothetical protein
MVPPALTLQLSAAAIIAVCSTSSTSSAVVLTPDIRQKVTQRLSYGILACCTSSQGGSVDVAEASTADGSSVTAGHSVAAAAATAGACQVAATHPTAAAAVVLLQVSLEPEGLPTVTLVADSPSSWKGDLLAVAVTSDDLHTSGVLSNT